MVDRLLQLKIYFSLLENEGDLQCNLNDSQWMIITDLHALLKPFMITQKLLEGQAYVTISLVPYMVYKTRKGLVEAMNRLTFHRTYIILQERCFKYSTVTSDRVLLEQLQQRICYQGSRGVLRE
jgi:hypothetical protein